MSSDQAFQGLLEYLFRNHGVDFSGYKSTSVQRRVDRRMHQLGLSDPEEYLDYLQVHPGESATLFDMILINVTAFFRDPPAWDFLRAEVVPGLLEAKREEHIRVWSAGCSSGEEAYTLAIVLAEAMGFDAFRERVKIYATDVDEEALQRARLGRYPVKELADLDEKLRDSYFETQGAEASFHPDLRRSVIFGRHDIVRDAPISHLDLLVCRNTLMYFTADTQAQVLLRFHYALNDEGCLFLGRAETLFTHSELFSPVDLRHRIFLKVPHATRRDRVLALASERGIVDPGDHQQERQNREDRLRDLALDVAHAAQIVVGATGTLVHANEAARSLLSLGVHDIGRRIADLELSYRPLELRSRIEQAQEERRVVATQGVERHLSDGAVQFLDIQVAPLSGGDGSVLGTAISFVDVTEGHQLKLELDRHKQELETAYEELQSSNEELETMNEELQSTVEELETTNEELHSANEELETMNEELQSTNSELQSINIDLRERSDELDRINAFMESVLTSVRLGIAVLGSDLRVQVWNRHAEDLWGMRADEVAGQRLADLDIGLPVAVLEPALQRISSGDSAFEEETVTAVNRRGRTIECRITCSALPLDGGSRGRMGTVMLMEDLAAGPTATDGA